MDVLDRLFQDLGSAHPEARWHAASALRYVFENDILNRKAQSTGVVDAVMTRLAAMVRSKDNDHKKGSITLIDKLLDVPDATHIGTTFIRYANCLRVLLQQSSVQNSPDQGILRNAAKVLGHLITAAPPALCTDIVDFQTSESLEWLRNRTHSQDGRVLAAVLILKEVAQNSPTQFNVHVKLFLQHIWCALWDTRVQVRLYAVAALQTCLKDLAQRDPRWRLQCYHQLYTKAQTGFEKQNAKRIHKIHGSLLVLGELLRSTGEFMWSRFVEVTEAIMALKDHKSGLISRTILVLLPQLSNLVPEAFARGYADSVVAHLLDILNSSNVELHSLAFMCLGEIGLAIRKDILKHRQAMIKAVYRCLDNRTKSKYKTFARTLHLPPPLRRALFSNTRRAREQKGDGVSDSPSAMPRSSSSSSSSTHSSSPSTTSSGKSTLRMASEHASFLSSSSVYSSSSSSALPSSVPGSVNGGHNRPTDSDQWHEENHPQAITPDHIFYRQTFEQVHPVDAALLCIGMLTDALGAEVSESKETLAALVDSMFRTGLSISLTHSLTQIGARVPEMMPSIQSRLLSATSSILTAPLQPKGMKQQERRKVPVYGAPELISSQKPDDGDEYKSESGADSSNGWSIARELRQSFDSYFSLSSKKKRSGSSNSEKDIHGGDPNAQYISEDVITRYYDGVENFGGEKASEKRETRKDSKNLLLLALNTLGSLSYRFECDRALSLVDQCVVRYLAHADPSVRKAAAVASTKLCVVGAKQEGRDALRYKKISDTLKRLAVVAVTDPLPALRCKVLSCFTHELDAYMSQDDILDTLIMSWNDECFEARRMSISLMSRWSKLNPGAVMPRLRDCLYALLADMQHSTYVTDGPSHDIEGSCILLGHVIDTCPDVVEPYVGSVLNVLVPMLALELDSSDSVGRGVAQNKQQPSAQEQQISVDDQVRRSRLNSTHHASVSAADSFPNPDALQAPVGDKPASFRNHVVATYVLSTLGRLSTICRKDMSMYIERLVPFVIAVLGEKFGFQRRHVAVRTLVQLLSSTRFEISPYEKYPQLLSTLLHLLRTERSQGLRVEVLKALGTLGALDPLKFRNEGVLHLSAEGNEDFGDGHEELPKENKPPKLTLKGNSADSLLSQNPEEYYPKVAISGLVRILKDPNLSPNLHRLSITATVFIFRSLGQKAVQFLPHVLPACFKLLQDADNNLKAVILESLAGITSIVRYHIRPYLDDMFKAVLIFWRELTLIVPTLNLVDEVSDVLQGGIRPFLPLMIPRAIVGLQMQHLRPQSVLDPVAYQQHEHGVVRILVSIQKLSQVRDNLATYLQSLLPCLLGLAEHSKRGISVRCNALRTLAVVIDAHNVSAYTMRIVHPLVRLLKSDHAELHIEVFQVLNVLVAQIGFQFVPFESLVAKTLARWPALSNKKGKKSNGTDRTALMHVNFHKYMVRLIVLFARLRRSRHQYRLVARDIPDDILDDVEPSRMWGELDFGGHDSGGDDSKAIHELREYRAEFNKVIRRYLVCAGKSDEARVGQLNRADRVWDIKEVDYLERVLDGDKFLATPLVDKNSLNSKYHDLDGKMGGVTKHHVSQQSIMKAWSATRRSTREDWLAWMTGFSLELLRESPSSALRSCSTVAQKYPPLAKELFNAAFLSCWTELFDLHQHELMRSLDATFQSPSMPPEIVHALLSLAEFMEQHDRALPVDNRTLGELAMQCHAYAKALHYKELEFLTAPATTVESLISINDKLHQPEAARGILKKVNNNLNTVRLQETWYEKLGRWKDALKAYEQKCEEDPEDWSSFLGRLRSLHALGENDALVALISNAMDTLSAQSEKSGGSMNGLLHDMSVGGGLESKTSGEDAKGNVSASSLHAQMAPLACAAYCSLSQWNKMEQHVEALQATSGYDYHFYSAVLAAHREDYDVCKWHVDHAYEHLDESLTTRVRESYNRAYLSIVKAQQLTELGEIIEFKTTSDSLARSQILDTWEDRLLSCRRDVDVWQSILMIRRLLVSPLDNVNAWLKFASLCRQADRVPLSLRVLVDLTGHSPYTYIEHPEKPLDPSYPRITYGGIKTLYWSGHKVEALHRMQELASSPALKKLYNRGGNAHHVAEDGIPNEAEELDSLSAASYQTSVSSMMSLKSRCYAKIAMWRMALVEENARPGSESWNAALPQVLQKYQEACVCDPQNYRAWHEWAVIHFRVAQMHGKSGASAAVPSGVVAAAVTGDVVAAAVAAVVTAREEDTGGDLTPLDHVAPALHGFFRSMLLTNNPLSTIQDILCVLSLYYKHGHNETVEQVFLEGINSISVDTWLVVIPQMIARLDSSNVPLRKMLQLLFCKIGESHPQALVYPLTVATKSHSQERVHAAISVLNSIRQHSPLLVEHAKLVSSELVRVAVLWHELWHEAIESASRHWFGHGNFNAMWGILTPLHHMLEAGPSTLRERSFVQSFGHELSEAYEWCKRYSQTRSSSAMKRAWDLYSTVFRRMNKQMGQMTEFALDDVSPTLLTVRDLELAIPGTYSAGKPIVKIAHFHPTLLVVESKQHPRKCLIAGDDGRNYAFLLKGREDMRQDERVMQLFSLVNTLLANDRDTIKSDLSITRYEVVPLSPTSGVCEWVPNCDTVHAVIKQYRDARKILLNIEQKLIMKMSPDYQFLTLIQKVEVFQFALSMTTGQDLCRMLWLKSPNAETWLHRRTNYTTSLAVMSMVGYILGLGDRHPCNLMLDRNSGKIVHIDFGDCFEVAMHRDKYPEKVPFRLTRMLINAMEVSGIEGTFRTTCEDVMTVLRENRNSLMTLLEAFVYDPLINWKLLDAKEERKEGEEDGKASNNDTATTTTTTATATKSSNVAAASAPEKLPIKSSILPTTSAEEKEKGMEPVVAANGAVPEGKNPLEDAKKGTNEDDGVVAVGSSPVDRTAQAATVAVGSSPSESPRDRSTRISSGNGGRDVHRNEVLNSKAVSVISRVASKLTGTDFNEEKFQESNAEESKNNRLRVLSVKDQVDRLIEEAMSHQNLSQAYLGWCPWW